MRLLMSLSRTRIISLAGLLGLVAFGDQIAVAQGCLPSRFTSPALGSLGAAGGDIYVPSGTWQVGFAYRYVNSNQLIVGHQARNDLAPGGVPSFVHSQLLNVSLVYGVTDQLTLTLNTPFARGSLETTYPDLQRHQNTAAGLGEMSVSASYWLKSAHPLQPGGNLAFGIGIKAPTGRNDVTGTFWKADGTTVSFPVSPAIELGDGGWGYVLGTKGFLPIFERSYLYGGGSYTFNPRLTTDVVKAPGSTLHWAAPDTWDASAGLSTFLSSALGLSANLGVLAYGTPRRDVFGGRDNGERLPAISGYVSPGIGITRGAHTITFSLPVRAYMNFRPSFVDAAAGIPGGGGLARRLILLSYSVRS
ncbi:MAG: hypothetical protein ACJ796_16130 [Gemmatimonadaceae bacterium]